MFLHPIGLLALLGVPLVVALHLFRRRFRPQTVSALFLWSSDEPTPLAGRKRERLQRSASFWLETLAALLLALAFAGPRVLGAGQADHLVVVLDASASMGARPGGGESFAQRALALVERRLDALSGRARATIVQSGPRPTVLAGPAAFPAEAHARLASYSPGSARHDLTPAVALALELAGEGEVLLVTDRFEPERYPVEVAVRAVGEPLANVAIANASRARGPEGERVYLTVKSLADEPVVRDLALGAEGVVLEERRLELAPGERRHVAFELPAGAPAVEARLREDALAIDDVAVLAPVPPRTLALAAALPRDEARVLGLAGREGSLVASWLELVPDAVEAERVEDAHVVIARAPLPDTWTLAIDARGEERKDLVGPFLVEKRHPLLDGVTLEGFVWSADPEHVLPGAPLVSAGNLPLVTDERTPSGRAFHLDLDPARSSLQRSPDWPILLANLAELRRDELPGARRTNVRSGETFVWHASETGEPSTYVLSGAGEEREVVARGTLAVQDFPGPGLYTLTRDGRRLCEIGVSFADADESDLRELSSGERPAQGDVATVRAGFTWIEIVLVAAVLGCVLGDWWVLKRATLRHEEAS